METRCGGAPTLCDCATSFRLCRSLNALDIAEQRLIRNRVALMKTNDHHLRQSATGLQNLGNLGSATHDRYEVRARKPTLIDREFDRFEWRRRIDCNVFTLVDVDKRCKDLELVTFGRPRLRAPETSDLSERRHVVLFGSDWLDVHGLSPRWWLRQSCRTRRAYR